MCSSNVMYGMFEDWNSGLKLTIRVKMYKCLEKYIKWILKNFEQIECSITLAKLTVTLASSNESQEITKSWLPK